MADDWEDEDTGTDFGSNQNQNGYGKSDDGDNDYKNNRNDGGGGRGGGRGRGRGGRGGGRGGGGGGFNRNRENGDNENDGDNRKDRGGFGNRRENEENNENEDGEFKKDKPKEFYIPPEVSTDEKEIFGGGIESGINFQNFDKIPIKITGDSAPSVITSFAEAGLKQFLLENVTKSGYKDPTPIQKASIPVVMAKKDLMACSQTGSGKTAAFLLPMLHDMLTENRDVSVGKPHALIISPTRELTSQIYHEARKFAHGSYLKLCVLYGGTSTRHQIGNLTNSCHLVVATCGRLLDFVNRGFISFEDIRFVVLDEADRMLDMGFLPDIEKIMNHPSMVPLEKRQTLMFSATFPNEIQELAGKFLNSNYIFITVGLIGGACSDITQTIYEVKRFDKRNKLLEILKNEDPDGTIIFVETQRQADFLASFISETNIPTTSIHGARDQRQREEALQDFRAKKMKILVATSVAARGLDIKNVRHVINYDIPKFIDDYIHRIGRTGRVGNRGKASSFYDPETDSAVASSLKKILEESNQDVPDFLKNGCGGGDSYSFHDKNGMGTDIRGDNNNDAVTNQEPTDDWN